MKLFRQRSFVPCALAGLLAGCHLIFPYDVAQGPAQQDGGKDAVGDLPRDGHARTDATASMEHPARWEVGLPPDIAAGDDFAFDVAGDAAGGADLHGVDTGALDVAPADMADLLTAADLDPSTCRKDLTLWRCTDNGGGCLSSCGNSYITCTANGDCTLHHLDTNFMCGISAAPGCELCDEALASDACWRP